MKQSQYVELIKMQCANAIIGGEIMLIDFEMNQERFEFCDESPYEPSCKPIPVSFVRKA